MYRFWFTPLLISVLGTILTVFYLTALNSVYLPIITRLYDGILWVNEWKLENDIIFQLTFSGFIGICAGFGVSIFAMPWDYLKNRRTDQTGHQTAQRLPPNIFWFGIYTILLVFINLAVFAIFRLFIPLMPPGLLTLWEIPVSVSHIGCIVLAMMTFTYSVFYSINSSAILTPRALRSKLLRSTRVEN